VTALQERLIASFLTHIEKIEKDLPRVVDGFGLSELTRGSMIWKAMTDWARDEDRKFCRKVERHLAPQVTRYFERQLGEWHQAVVGTEMKVVVMDVEKHLQEQATEYQRVMWEIEEKLGIRHTAVEIRALVEKWLGGRAPGEGFAPVALGGLGVGILGDMSWLLAGVISDIALHTTGILIPGIGAIITGFRLYMREKNIRDDIRKKLVEGLRTKLGEIVHSQMAGIRDKVREGFTGLRQKMGGSIGEEVALIEASLQSMIGRKREKEYSAEQERARLSQARAAIEAVIARGGLAVTAKGDPAPAWASRAAAKAGGDTASEGKVSPAGIVWPRPPAARPSSDR
jgi:hypothetical protein